MVGKVPLLIGFCLFLISLPWPAIDLAPVRATGGGPIPTNTNVGNQERLHKDRSYENSVVNTMWVTKRCWIKTIMRRIQLAPGSRGPGSNQELYSIKDRDN